MAENTTKEVSRRTFFKRAAGTAAGVAAATAMFPTVREASRAIAQAVKVEGEEPTLRMLDDMRRAQTKPMEEKKWGMIIDTRKCIGCHACTVACVAENNLPPQVTYRTVAEAEEGAYPDVKRWFMPTNCMQCNDAPCIGAANKVIPGSMSRRPDGIVVINYKKMKGKKVYQAATKACPYPKSLWYDEGKNYTDGTPAMQPYEKWKTKEYGQDLTRKDTKDTTRKCHFCTHKIDAGLLPACITTCTGQAMYFGDLKDQESLVSKMLKSDKSVRMNLAAGIGPAVYYVDDEPEVSCMSCHS